MRSKAEKIYLYYSYVMNNPDLSNVRYIVKTDDDAVLCPKMLFKYLNKKHLTLTSYAGWFHHMDTWESKINKLHRVDGMFLLLGRDLVHRIVNQTYCHHGDSKECDTLGQLFDTGWDDESVALWISTMKDVNPLPLNHVFTHTLNSNKRIIAEKRLVYHAAKELETKEKMFSECQKIML